MNIEQRPVVTEYDNLKFNEFVLFKGESISDKLVSWEVIELIPHKQWIAQHKQFHHEENNFAIVINRPVPAAMASENSATFLIDNKSASLVAPLPDVRGFYVGDVTSENKIGDKVSIHSGTAVIFKSINNKYLTVFDDGYCVPEGIKVIFDPHY